MLFCPKISLKKIRAEEPEMKKTRRNNLLLLKLCLISTLFWCITNVSGAVAATSSIIINAENGEVLSSSAADTLRYPASLTKVMTLYITFDALEKGLIKLDDKLPVSRNAANRSPSKLGVRAGETIKVKDAIMALIVKSANDCATVLAEGLGYTEENFAKTMTKVARELGMRNTTFKNASGLPNKAQKTTARDMALLGAAMYHHFPQYYSWFSAKKFTYKGQTIYTHNHLLKSFEGADGMKTGYTAAAGFNIITSAQRDGQRVIAVTMGHKTAKNRDQKVAQLMDKALTKLAMNDNLNNSNIYAKLEEKNIKSENEIQQVANAKPENAPEETFGIQVGAFSNYTKARNYALKIKQEVSRKFSNKNIAVEPTENGAAIVYRSQIIGFEKNDADEACKGLKKSNKSCIVVAVNSNKQLLLAHSKY